MLIQRSKMRAARCLVALKLQLLKIGNGYFESFFDLAEPALLRSRRRLCDAVEESLAERVRFNRTALNLVIESKELRHEVQVSS